MYGKGAGTVNTATGVALLPATGDNRVLFIVAASLIASGVVIFVVASVLARKNRRSAES